MTQIGTITGNTENSRTDEQRLHMQSTVGQGLCPLCGEGFDPKKNVVIWTGQYWRAWFNPFPYAGTKTHLIFAAIEHITNIADLPVLAWLELGVQIERFIRKYNLQGGGIVMRFGDNALNGGTLFHLHVHIQVPSEDWFCIAVFFKDEPMMKFLLDAGERFKAKMAAGKPT